ncbi:hypothetical protein [Nonomuraea sp. NPDC050783]|uniref:hypothetical protein n=1 Tax=Nonomuraea sp. NPDC050783 TaxID=3154634 RepID=UPI0034663F4F
MVVLAGEDPLGGRPLLVRTPAGRRLSARVRAFRQELYAEAVRDWPAADREQFARLLTTFVRSLGAATR